MSYWRGDNLVNENATNSLAYEQTVVYSWYARDHFTYAARAAVLLSGWTVRGVLASCRAKCYQLFYIFVED
jgi:hypothetical protein